MEHTEYLTSLAYELMADPDWELPQQLRFFLVADLAWGLLSV